MIGLLLLWCLTIYTGLLRLGFAEEPPTTIRHKYNTIQWIVGLVVGLLMSWCPVGQ